MSRHRAISLSHRGVNGFTLTELLIVMGVIGVLSVLTLISMRVIARNAKLAASTNTVFASLDNARAIAIRDGNLVLLAFRPRIENGEDVVVDLVACRWTGESYPAAPVGTIDRFEPIADFPVRTLSSGIKVAAPSYRTGNDLEWTTQSHLPRTQAVASPEWPGALLGVMYGPDGTILTSNPRTDASLIWVDFNHHPTYVVPRIELDMFDPDPIPIVDLAIDTNRFDDYFRQIIATDEPFITFAPFIAVYDDEAARELKDPVRDWGDEQGYVNDLTGPDGYITRLGNRIYFNRYTGVALK